MAVNRPLRGRCPKGEEGKKTRPDTRQSSRGRLGRSSYAKTTRNSKMRQMDVQTDRRTRQGGVACPRLKSKWKKNKVIRPKSRALAFQKKLDRRTDWSSQNDPQISILYLPVRVEIRFDYQSPVILCRNKWCAKK